ncbi:MAG: hypoxanthine phosphoribosyltransferase [Proteobacteria bacterium]|nr:hypoxanthine phosphoribosyltransferase [Pseudomonadota bacterium]
MLKPLFTKEEIDNAVRGLALSIERDFDDEEIYFVCLLKGSFMFMSDLIRYIKNPSKIDFMRVSSYGNAMESKGEIIVTKDIEEDIQDKNVIIVEDIIDSGLTLRSIKKMLLERNPKSLKICALLDKRARRQVEMEGDYVGLTIEDGFVVGYGIDYAEQYRNLPEICVVEKDCVE